MSRPIRWPNKLPMIRLRDFFHLPQVDKLVAQLITDQPGLVIVAGLDPRPINLKMGENLLAGGRPTLFRILLREMLEADESAWTIIVTESKTKERISRQLRNRVETSNVLPHHPYSERIAAAVRRRPSILVVDRLSIESIGPVLDAVQSGIRVLTQFDTVLWGANITRQLLDLGVTREQLEKLIWIFTVQRLPTLCPKCKTNGAPTEAQLNRLRQRYADFSARLQTCFQVTGCDDCDQTGRHGDVIAFDIFRSEGPDCFDRASLLPVEEYIQHLVELGHMPLDDLLQFESDQLRRTYSLYTTSESSLVTTNAALESKLTELEAANRVLEQRTKALVSFQGIGQTLIASTELMQLASRVCRHVHELCGADRAVLYYLRSDSVVEIIAVNGWSQEFLFELLDTESGFEGYTSTEPMPYNRWPPGIPPRSPDVEGAVLRAGLYVPLWAQDEQVGLMIVHSTQKPRFEPGEVSLLQTFANQAAIAIERTGLIEQLRTKIIELQEAQAELARKERMERELELARQVQQSMLPHTFPHVPSFQFAARYESARQVGGDFYDVIMLDSQYFGVAVADVSDKGMPAALYMALTRSLLLAEARREQSPSAVLANVNHLLLELGEPNMFVTMFYGVIEQATGQLTYARAGHDRPILLRNNAIQELAGRGLALGLFDTDDLRLSDEHMELLSGDRLVLYSDGLTDVSNQDGQLFDLGRFKTLLQSYASLSPNDLCSAIFGYLSTYQSGTEHYDDMTLLVVGVD